MQRGAKRGVPFSLLKLQYFYDDAGRLTRLYDSTNSFYYYYNASGVVTKQTDWGGRETTYAYDDLYQMTGETYLAGTGNAKTWSFAYTGAGEPDSVTAPNGMVTDYVYDANGLMTDLLHKSGSTVKQGFSYLYDDAYNITKMTHEDGAYWTYGYDNRYRLTTAVRHNSAGTIKANYSYTYDAGDNLVTKVEPWSDDFGDGNATDEWLSSVGTWSVVNGAAQNATNASVYPELQLAVTDDDTELRYTYSIDSVQSGTPWVETVARWEVSTAKQLTVDFYSTKAEVWQYDGTAWTRLAQNTGATSATGTKYSVRVELDGVNMKVWRSTGGGLETQVFSITNAPTYNSDRVRFIVNKNMVASLDDVMVMADDRSSTTTFTPATNNELASASDYNGSTTYAYDALGRMSTEIKNSVTKTYTWTSANLLAGVDSSASGDTDVAYTYTGDLKRLWRWENGSLKNSYQWDAAFNVVSESAWSGGSPISTKTYADGLAEVDVTSTPSYAYLTQDHLGSTRGLWDGSIVQTATWEYTPYGAPYRSNGAPGVTRLYTGHDLDGVTGNYYAPFRTLNPGTGRWSSQDPLGMADGTNMFGYVGGSPVMAGDPLGLLGTFGDNMLLGIEIGKGFLEGARDGAKQLVDVVIPFYDPGNYDPNGPGMQAGRRGAQVTRHALEGLLPAGLLRWGSNFLNGTKWFGRTSKLLGRGKHGVFNQNDYLRLGWGWNGNRGRQVIRAATGSPLENGPGWLRNLWNYLRHMDLT